MLIVEFVFATHCILTQGQVKPELPDSPQLLHRNTTFSIGVPIYAKLTMERLPLARYASTLRSDGNLLAFGSIVCPVEAIWCENSTILSSISAVVDLHEESGPTSITQQIIKNMITLS